MMRRRHHAYIMDTDARASDKQNRYDAAMAGKDKAVAGFGNEIMVATADALPERGSAG